MSKCFNLHTTSQCYFASNAHRCRISLSASSQSKLLCSKLTMYSSLPTMLTHWLRSGLHVQLATLLHSTQPTQLAATKSLVTLYHLARWSASLVLIAVVTRLT